MKLTNRSGLTCFLMMISACWAGAQSMEWVTVGDAGNTADSTGFGAVGYEYQIGKYEVTNAQYAEFLNAKGKSDPGGFSGGLYHFYHANNPTVFGITRSGTSGSYVYTAASGRENNPVAYVNWFDAARFVNWMHNGKGNGDTEDGVYDMSLTGVARMTAKSGAKYRLPTPDEWYKAAYYDPTKDGVGGYWNYATQSDTAPLYGAPGGGSNLANVAPGPSSNPRVYAVGSYTGSSSYYGTFDQNGNVYEWVNQTTDGGDAFAKGSGWAFGTNDALKTNFGGVGQYTLSGGENDHNGFRIVSVVPEPSSVALLGLAGLCWLIRRKK